MSSSKLISRSSTTDKEGRRVVKRVYAVSTDSEYHDENNVLSIVGVPFGANLAGTNLYANGFDVTQHDLNLREWTVSITYQKFEPNPLSRPPRISGGFQSDTEMMPRAEDGTPVRNTAGDFFNDMLFRNNPRQIFTITRNEISYPSFLANVYRRAVNSDFFLGFPPNTVQVAGIDFSPVENEVFGDYYEIAYSFEVNPSGFDAHVLSEGKRQIVDGKLEDILEKNVPIEDPVPLAANGERLPEGQPPVWLTFQKYPRLPFSIFNF